MDVSETRFTLSVINDRPSASDSSSSYYERPEFNLNLVDQVVTVGHSLAYMINFEQIDADNNYRQQPFAMQASVSMSKIKSFAVFD